MIVLLTALIGVLVIAILIILGLLVLVRDDRDAEFAANAHLTARCNELLGRLELTTSELGESSSLNRLPIRFVTIVIENREMLRKHGR